MSLKLPESFLSPVDCLATVFILAGVIGSQSAVRLIFVDGNPLVQRDLLPASAQVAVAPDVRVGYQVGVSAMTSCDIFRIGPFPHLP